MFPTIPRNFIFRWSGKLLFFHSAVQYGSKRKLNALAKDKKQCLKKHKRSSLPVGQVYVGGRVIERLELILLFSIGLINATLLYVIKIDNKLISFTVFK